MRVVSFSNASAQPFPCASISFREPTASKPAARSGLRIVRERDSAVGADCAGRMVISGRMADVCAELDRMALRAADSR